MENLLLLYSMLFTILGIFMGLYLSNSFLKKQFKYKLTVLQSDIEKRERCLRDLEDECRVKKRKLDEIIKSSIECKSKLLKTSNDLQNKMDELYKVQERLKEIKKRISNIEQVERENIVLLNRVSKLEEAQNRAKDEELSREIERLKGLIEARDRELESLKQEKLSESKNYLKISKDQFYQIEARLKEYKGKLESLENRGSGEQKGQGFFGKGFKFKEMTTSNFY